MKIQDIENISCDDASMYYDGAYAISLTGDSPTILITYIVNPDGLGRNINALDYIDSTDLPETSAQFLVFCPDTNECFAPEEFFSKYKVVRIPLGWRNALNTCVYLYSAPDRGVKKGYQPRDFKMYCPYAKSLNKYRQSLIKKLRNEVEAIDNVNKVDKLLRQHTAKQKSIETFLRIFAAKDIASLGPLEKVLPANCHKFFSIEEAIESLCDYNNLTRTGAALHSSIAATITSFSPKNGASVFFHYNPVGTLTRNGIEVYTEYNSIVPQLERHLGVRL